MDYLQYLCLKWNNYHSNLSLVFTKLYTKEAFVDCTLSCEGKKIKCHKLILSACSPYFEDLLLDNPCQHPIIVLNGISHLDMLTLVKFMYYGEVNVSQENLENLLKVAVTLKIKGLTVENKQSREDAHSLSFSKTFSQEAVVKSDILKKKGERNTSENCHKRKAKFFRSNDADNPFGSINFLHSDSSTNKHSEQFEIAYENSNNAKMQELVKNNIKDSQESIDIKVENDIHLEYFNSIEEQPNSGDSNFSSHFDSNLNIEKYADVENDREVHEKCKGLSQHYQQLPVSNKSRPYTLQEKQQVVDAVRKGMKVSDVSRAYNVPWSTVKFWCKRSK